MKNIYKESKNDKAVSRLVKVSVIMMMIMAWVLIDKGNVYGQSIADKDLVVKQLDGIQIQSPLLRPGDDSRGDDHPTEDEGNDFVTKPNPVERDLVFDFEFTVKVEIPYEVIGPLGRLVAQGVFAPGISTQSIDFSQFKPSLYFVRLDFGDKVEVRRIIKK